MDTITVTKADLIEVLRKNREEHHAIYVEAKRVYREKMIEEMDRALAEARSGGPIKRGFSLPLPEDHTKDFDDAIEMLELDLGDTVELSLYEFRQYYKNEWGWAQSFAANSLSYTQQR
jgi:hypothetical protein